MCLLDLAEWSKIGQNSVQLESFHFFTLSETYQRLKLIIRIKTNIIGFHLTPC